MNALNWIRGKAVVTAVETFDGDGKTYRVTRSVFRGTLPARMAHEVRKLYGDLVNNELELETLRVGGEYRSDFGRCEYIRAVYEVVA